EITLISEEPVEDAYDITSDYEVIVKKGDIVKEKDVLAKNKHNKSVIRTKSPGKIKDASEDMVTVVSEGNVEKTYDIPFGRTLKVQNNQTVNKGQALTTGHFNLRELMKLTDLYTVQKYIMTEVQSIYASQGQTINDKHIEIIARQMLSKVRILDAGDSVFLPGEMTDIMRFEEVNRELEKDGKRIAKGDRLLLGLTRVSLCTDSWLSAASFQETIRVLVEAATTNRIDNLEGLKENVIIGKLIPAGETYKKLNPEYMPPAPIAEDETSEEDERQFAII
ncbi:MAG TPA: DNA-directed RNA polymerase subunit beta', partial [Candidatus Gracilibacteria bacterium]|nr:DNA-directed RNA polymerase subunit beta' [Candidatus Gracilibacteria bacterium]